MSPAWNSRAWRRSRKTPGFDANAPNITPDKETGIGNWTDAQIIASIREGKRPDGTIIGPPMPIGLYPGMSDDDANAIVAYLRQVKPIRNKIPPSVYRIPLPPAYGPPWSAFPRQIIATRSPMEPISPDQPGIASNAILP